MIIVASGCSFIWGDELSDHRHHGANGYSHLTWPANIAKNQNTDYVCVASAGSGNTIITRNVINFCEQNQDIFVIVQWTWPFRFDFAVAKKNHWETIGPWQADQENRPGEKLSEDDVLFDYAEKNTQIAKRNGINELANTFFKYIGSGEYWPVYSTLKEIIFLQNYLKSKHIPYLFSCADASSIFYNYTVQKSNDPFINNLINQIDMDNWSFFEPGINWGDTKTPRGFYQWAVENKYAIAPGGHPLEQAHIDASNIMQEKFNELVKKHLQ
jgi:hypothetical protein